MRLINEDDVLRIVERVTNEAVEKNQRKYLIQPRIIAEISGLPTIEAEPVKHGRWIDNGIYDSMLSACSICGYSCGAYSFNYCPNCGARMDLGLNGKVVKK